MAKHALVIGAGHNGLVCACYLARAGLDVTVIERRSVVGGAAVTEEFHPGFRNSVASYTVSLLQPKIINDLRLYRHGLKILERPVDNFLPLPSGDGLTSYRDPGEMRREVARFSRRDADRLGDFYDALEPVTGLLRSVMMQTPPALHPASLRDLWKLLALGSRFTRLGAGDKQQLLRLFSVSAGELLDDYFESEPIKALIGFDAVVGNYASPFQAGSAYVLVHHLLGEVNGRQGQWGQPVGGMGAITQAMAREAQVYGVSLQTSRAVKKVIVKGGSARGVLLDDGEAVHADVVISNLNPKLLFLKLLDERDLAAGTIEHFRRYKNQSGSFRMNVALGELPAFTAAGSPEVLTGGIIIAPSLGYMDRAYRDARAFGFSREPVIEMLLPSLLDASLAPEGRHVASLFCQQFDPGIGKAWLQRKQEAADTILATVDRYAPNFSSSILGVQILSPYDLEQEFGLVGGDIFHGRMSIDQLFSARPMLGYGQYATEIKNLYMCGSGTHPGGGVSGAPGHNAAREILRRMGALSPARG